MPQEDKFKREIDRIGLVLAKLLDLLLDKGRFSNEEVAHFMQQCKTALNIDIDEFLHMDKEAGLDLLIKDHQFSNENLRNFGHMLYDLAHKTDDENQKELLLNKALHIYEYLVNNSKGTLYLDVLYRMKELQ